MATITCAGRMSSILARRILSSTSNPYHGRAPADGEHARAANGLADRRDGAPSDARRVVGGERVVRAGLPRAAPGGRAQADGLSEVSEAGLPDEIRPLVQELNLLFKRVGQAFEAQKSFVADAAHELRSPLAALKLQAQGLKRAADDAAREVAIGRLTAGIERATRLVEQLLVLARQQASAATGARLQPVALADIARLAVTDAAPSAQAHRINLGLEHVDEGDIAGHAEALRILVANLVDNAVKYTPPGGAVDVEIHRAADRMVLSVDDTGPGIAQEERARVLDRFYRVVGKETFGSGLGLAIVKSIADVHGAALSLDRSQHLGGLRVEVIFPFDAAPPPRSRLLAGRQNAAERRAGSG